MGKADKVAADASSTLLPPFKAAPSTTMPEKYVPPHLRGRGDNETARRGSNRGGGGGGDRWSNGARRPSNPRSSYIRRGSDGGTSTSRWAGPPPSTKVAFFGDSFVRLFGLLQRPDILVKAFKAATAKGLGREANDNRATIAEWVASPQAQQVERLVFCFGSVDVHLSYYYGKYVQGQEINLQEIAQQYVDFVADLPTSSAVTKTIVGVYPSPLDDSDVGPSLVSYGSLKTDEQAALMASQSDDVQLQKRQERVRAFNRAVRERCLQRGIEYDDLEDVILDPQTQRIKDAYRDVSNHNIHIVWETTLMVWIERWNWLRELIPPGFAEGLHQTLDEYLATKPWAERRHSGLEGQASKLEC